MARGRVCPLSSCQVVLVVVAALMATLAVAMLAGGYQAMMRYAVNQVRNWSMSWVILDSGNNEHRG